MCFLIHSEDKLVNEHCLFLCLVSLTHRKEALAISRNLSKLNMEKYNNPL